MAATGFQSAQVQLFDDNGDPLAGGKLYFYEAGSSTPQDTFTQSDLDPMSANTNPVILDSAGRAVIYFSPTPAYKCLCTDANDVEVWTQDEISPAAVAS
jgi:hypothetical protein